MSESNTMAHFNNSFASASRLFTSNLSSITIVFRRFFTWIALGDVDLRFSLMLIIANAVEEEINESRDYINNVIHTRDWQLRVMSLPSSLLHKISAATDRLCQIALNRKLWRKFEKNASFASRVEVKSGKTRPACTDYWHRWSTTNQ